MTNENNSNDRYMGLRLFAVVALAFLAALCFRRSAGIIAMTPVALILAGVAAFIRMNTAIKCAVFGITVFTLNTMECDDISVAVTFTALCILATAVFGISASLIGRKKKYGYAVFAAGAAVSILLCFVYVGNPITALSANDTLTDYARRNYPESENAALGNFGFSKIYYRYDTKAYCIDAVSDKYPTEQASLTLGETVVCDGFKSIMTDKITQPYIAEMSSVLRSSFPDASFEVSFDRFYTLPGSSTLSAGDGELYGNICYEIYIGGVQTAEQMQKQVIAYINAIDESGIGYARITFKSGIGSWQRRSVTVSPNHPADYPEYDIKYCNTASSNLLNEYLFGTLLKN